MSTTVEFNGKSVYYANGVSGSSNVVGWESSQTRVVRHSFIAPAEGGSRFSFSIGNHDGGGGTLSAPIRFYVGTSPTSHEKANKDSEYHGTVTMTKLSSGEYVATGEVEMILMPNTTYYLWFFPGSTTYGWYSWYINNSTLTIHGAAGLVAIDIGSEIIKAIPFADDGSGWRQAMPHIDNGIKWNLCS